MSQPHLYDNPRAPCGNSSRSSIWFHPAYSSVIACDPPSPQFVLSCELLHAGSWESQGHRAHISRSECTLDLGLEPKFASINCGYQSTSSPQENKVWLWNIRISQWRSLAKHGNGSLKWCNMWCKKVPAGLVWVDWRNGKLLLTIRLQYKGFCHVVLKRCHWKQALHTQTFLYSTNTVKRTFLNTFSK